VIGGVASGVAKALDMDPSIVRVVWVLLAFMTGGIAGFVYLIMLIVVPQEPIGAQPLGGEPPGFTGSPGEPAAPVDAGGAPGPAAGTEPGASWSASGTAATPAPPPLSRAEARRARRVGRDSGGAIIFGVILILVGGYFLVRQYVPQVNLDIAWPVVVIVVGLLLLFGALRPGARSGD
jgi:phage shock protein PspC (stress-responsive transcriptional regulator)